jgi:geranylgeranyl pyrophosphate synthase/uncharacterized protein with NAD-binding domain and iron-sulfur cluster
MPKVVVLGGGVGGFSAAHELAERGFEVVVIEKTGIPGGKARSSPVLPVGPSPWSAAPRYPHAGPGDHVSWIPGEHGFRFFPGFYKHVVDTMSRIPTPTGVSAADHLVAISRCDLTQYDKPTLSFPMRFPRTPGDAGTAFAAVITGLSSVTGLTTDDLALFGNRVWQILTSCPERRLAEYEQISWWDFIDARSRSVAYQKFLAAGITRSLVAARAESASTRTIGNIFVQLLLDILDPLVATSDRVLDGPTNQTWIYPWLNHLRDMGVAYHAETEVTEIETNGGRVTGVRVSSGGTVETIQGDYYVAALPVERFAPLLTPGLLALDPQLASVRQLVADSLEWMNGVQFYFRRPVRLVRGHMNHIDTEWSLTSISQVDVWRAGTMERYGPEAIQGIVSVDVSNWESPAPDGRTAMEHSREEVCLEVWRQLKRSVNVPGEKEILRDEDLIGWFMDSDIDRDPSEPQVLANSEPLLVNLKNTWHLRPEAVTNIPNLFLASDYVRTHTDLATMEAANEAARRAVNGILQASSFSGTPCQLWPLHEPAVFAPLRHYDATRFGLGLPWDPGLLPVAAEAIRATNPIAAPVANMLATAVPALSRARHALEQIDEILPINAIERSVAPFAETLQRVRDEAETSSLFKAVENAALGALESLPVSPVHLLPDGAVAGATGAEPAGFMERLADYRAMTLACLEDALPTGEPGRFLYEPIREFVARPSKGLRPALCIATCLAYGGRAEEVLPSAAGIELLHNAFLVHDDIEDGSESRRGRPTLHRLIGLPLAVNVGDAMNALSMRLFRRNLTHLPPEAAYRILDEVEHMLLESLEGQSMELGWIRENNCRVATDDYLRLVLKKTGWYSFIHPMTIGAIAARPREEGLERFHAFGFLLGAAFQIQDDVLNLIGQEALYGKEIGGDLWEGKRTLALAHAFDRSDPASRARLESFFARPREQRLPRQLFEVQKVLEDSGSIEWAKQIASSFARAAHGAFPVAFRDAHDGADLAFIRSLVDYVVRRRV